MSDPSPPFDSERIWKRNLDALRRVDPELAGRMETLRPGPNCELVEGREGSPTYRLQTADGPRWLGFTSMPTVSGAAILSNFDPGSGNVVLAGIGQGIEARLLTQRLPAHRVVFVLERNPEGLVLALRLHDVSAPIAEGRLALVVGEDEAAALVDYLADREGVLAPERMVAWPWLDPPSTDRYRLLIQRAGSEIAQRRAAHIASLTEQLRAGYESPSSLPDIPRIFVISPGVDAEASAFAGEVLDGLKLLNWPVTSWSGNRPDTQHPLSLVRGLHAFRPDLVIAVDATRTSLSRFAPESLPIAAWLGPQIRVSAGLLEGLGSRDHLFCMTDRVMQDLLEVGADPQRLTWLPPAIASPPNGADGESGDRPEDVVAIADAMPLAPEANGLHLDSHQAVWKTAERLITDQAARYVPSDAGRILSQAESATGASFAEPALRREFIEHINSVLGRTIVWRETLLAILDAGLRLSLWGAGWAEHPKLSSAYRGRIRPEEHVDVYASGKVYLHAALDGNVATELLRAAASGAVVVARGHPDDSAGHGLPSILALGSEALSFRRRSELIGHVKGLLGDEESRRKIADRARERIVSDHMMDRRIRQILETMRARHA